jgi:hypothetical protein
MDRLNSESSFGNNSALLLLAALGSALVLLVAFLGMRSQIGNAIVVLFAVGSLWIATQMPVGTVAVYWVLMILPNCFLLSPIGEVIDIYIYSLKPPDIMLIVMSAATMIRLFRFPSRPRTATVALGIFAALFLALVAYGVLRNLEKYGIRAPGEFRHRYLVLSAALYVAAYFDTPEIRLRMMRVLTMVTVFLVFACMPIAAFVSGWTPGSGDRLFPAEVSLAFLFGLVAILLMRWNGFRTLSSRLAYWSVPFGLLQIVLDNHRSVWLAAMVIMVILVLMKQVSMLRLTAAAAVFVLVTLAGKSFVSANQDRSFSEFMTERALAFTNPEADGTAYWRIQQWELQMPKFRDNPVFGIGLGGYWGTDDNLVVGNLGVMPHNYYVGTLVKLGATGLAGYLMAIVALVVLLGAAYRSGMLEPSDRVICMLALLVLFGAHAYYWAYCLDASSWLWIGLGAAACVHMRRPQWFVRFD